MASTPSEPGWNRVLEEVCPEEPLARVDVLLCAEKQAEPRRTAARPVTGDAVQHEQHEAGPPGRAWPGLPRAHLLPHARLPPCVGRLAGFRRLCSVFPLLRPARRSAASSDGSASRSRSAADGQQAGLLRHHGGRESPKAVSMAKTRTPSSGPPATEHSTAKVSMMR